VSVALCVAAACVPPPPDPPTGPSPDDAPRAGEAAYVQPGPYAAGVTTLTVDDRTVEVWYPAEPADAEGVAPDTYYIRDFVASWVEQLLQSTAPDVDPPFVTDGFRGIPASDDGPFPLVVFSHGFASFNLQSSFLTTHLASWGFVVIAPQYLSRALKAVLGEPPPIRKTDARVADEAIEAVKAASATPGGLLEATVDATSVYPVGHSAGGGTSIALLQRPDVPSAIALAAGISELDLALGDGPDLPEDEAVTWIGGRRDGIAEIANVRTGFRYTPGPRRLVELDRSGHNNAFTDICEIGDGGIAAVARATGLPIPDALLALGDNGCRQPTFAPSAEVWDEVRHFVTAELRLRAGLDDEPVGLGSQVSAAFDDVLVYRHDP
jgi:hypothetical protein